MEGFELYKLLITEDNEHGEELATEIRWVSDDELLVWVPYIWFGEFIESITNILGHGIFDDGGFDGNIQKYGVCINLFKVVDGYGIDLKEIFPLKKYSN